jgi:RHS repeat-associated protein
MLDRIFNRRARDRLLECSSLSCALAGVEAATKARLKEKLIERPIGPRIELESPHESAPLAPASSRTIEPHMHLSSGLDIPDGLLAANALLAENSRQGSATLSHTLHQGFGVVISHTSLGISGSLYDGRARCRYTGKERDAESGLDYFGARYYSSNMGRFSSPDPSGLASVNPANPQSWNLYSYVLNNPLINVDPTGLDCVYYNDAGTGLDTDGTPIDHNSDSGTCKQTGGNWVEGTTSADLNHYDAGSGTWTAASYDKNNAYIYSGMSPGGPGSGNDSTNYMPACQGNCLSGSSAPISSLIGQLQGGGTLYGMLQFAVSQPLSAGVNGFQATSISANYGNTTTGSGWCGSGGSGPPGNSNGWSCLAHDYGYFVTGNAYPGGNYNPNYSGGPQLQKINQTLCNNVSGFGGFEIKAFFTATVWGCRP